MLWTRKLFQKAGAGAGTAGGAAAAIETPPGSRTGMVAAGTGGAAFRGSAVAAAATGGCGGARAIVMGIMADIIQSDPKPIMFIMGRPTLDDGGTNAAGDGCGCAAGAAMSGVDGCAVTAPRAVFVDRCSV